MYNLPKVKVQLVKDGNIKIEQRPVILSPDDVAAIMYPVVELLAEEHSYALLLNIKNRVNAIHEVSIGSLGAAIIHPREVFRAAILSNAASIILVHNHPSGDPTPSPEDVDLTKRLVEAGSLIDIPILDHIIVCPGRYASLKERGVL
jgi:DNA repair protein RadC